MGKKLIKYGSILPLILFIVSVVMIVSMALVDDAEPAAAVVLIMFAATVAAVVLCWFYIIYLMIHAYKNLDSSNKVLWMILVYMLNIFVFPVYCFKFLKV